MAQAAAVVVVDSEVDVAVVCNTKLNVLMSSDPQTGGGYGGRGGGGYGGGNIPSPNAPRHC